MGSVTADCSGSSSQVYGTPKCHIPCCPLACCNFIVPHLVKSPLIYPCISAVLTAVSLVYHVQPLPATLVSDDISPCPFLGDISLAPTCTLTDTHPLAICPPPRLSLLFIVTLGACDMSPACCCVCVYCIDSWVLRYVALRRGWGGAVPAWVGSVRFDRPQARRTGNRKIRSPLLHTRKGRNPVPSTTKSMVSFPWHN